MVYDCFLFYNELDVLEVRLNELDKTVDRFVLFEATRTFQYQKKPLYFEQNKKRFEKFLPKIIHLIGDGLPDFTLTRKPGKLGKFENERAMRRLLVDGIKEARDDDVVMLSDVDEIPRENVPTRFLDVIVIRDSPEFMRCKMRDYLYFFNGLYREGMYGTVIMTLRYLRSQFRMDFSYAREARRHGPKFGDAGWHFSALGGVSAVIEKTKISSHVEYNSPAFQDREAIQKKIDAGICWAGDKKGLRVRYVSIDETFPKYIQENIERFKNMIRGG